MTREEREKAIAHGKEQLEVFGGEHAEFIKLATYTCRMLWIKILSSKNAQ